MVWSDGPHHRAGPRVVARIAWVAIGLTAGVYSPTAAAQRQNERIPANEWKRGYHGLGMVCRFAGMEIEDDSARFRQVPASQSLVIVLGSVQTLPFDAAYVARGGALLLAIDRGKHPSLAALGISVLPGPLKAVSDSHRVSFRGYI